MIHTESIFNGETFASEIDTSWRVKSRVLLVEAVSVKCPSGNCTRCVSGQAVCCDIAGKPAVGCVYRPMYYCIIRFQ